MKSLGSRHNQHSFAQIPSVNMARSKFDRSFAIKDTFDFDYLVPFLADEILPGDTVNMNVTSFMRLATQVKPVMDNMYVDWHFFFVPNRLVWNNWERFNGAQDDPGDSTDFLVPQVLAPDTDGWAVGSIADHFGIQTQSFNTDACAFPFRAYNLIWNEWFRDQNLQTRTMVPKGDGPDAPTNYVLKKRAKKHDYFTSCLPWPQKGSAVSLPLGSTAPVVMSPDTWLQPITRLTDTKLLPANSGNLMQAASTGNVYSSSAGNPGLTYDPRGTLIADLTAVAAPTINAIRQAFMYQSILELDARGGTRYVEILKAHFNVVSPDFRLQRPEFLASATTRINQHPVASTAATEDNPQANLASFSTAHGTGVGFSKSFVEHGWIIGLMSARADITYQYGLNRKWSRRTRFDYFWPKLQELGEQAVYVNEIYPVSDPKKIFGYQERYAEYRYHPSEIRGQFRSSYSESLDVWHLAEDFQSEPALNGTFIESSTPIERSLVVTENYPHLIADIWLDYKHARPIVTYGVPATLGRF